MRVRFGNSTKDVSLLEVTAANYIVPAGEEGTVHARIEQMQFNPQTGERQSRPRIQKFEPKMWPVVARNLRQQGWTIDVLYDPTEWLKKQAEQQSLTVAERQRMQAEAEAARRKAEKEAMKAEIIAELKEAGMIKDTNEGGKVKKEPNKGGSKKK